MSADNKAVPEPSAELLASTFFKGGREARAKGIPITKTAVRMMRPGCKEYYEFIDGYDYEAALRKRKPKVQP